MKLLMRYIPTKKKLKVQADIVSTADDSKLTTDEKEIADGIDKILTSETVSAHWTDKILGRTSSQKACSSSHSISHRNLDGLRAPSNKRHMIL